MNPYSHESPGLMIMLLLQLMYANENIDLHDIPTRPLC